MAFWGIGSKSTNTTDASGGMTLGAAIIGGGGGGGMLSNSSMQQAIIEDQYRRMQAMTEDSYRREYNINSENGRRFMVAMRLRLNEHEQFPFQHMSTAKSGDKVYVFILQNDQPVTLEDDTALFPSDTLVTQLRLMMK